MKVVFPKCGHVVDTYQFHDIEFDDYDWWTVYCPECAESSVSFNPREHIDWIGVFKSYDQPEEDWYK